MSLYERIITTVQQQNINSKYVTFFDDEQIFDLLVEEILRFSETIEEHLLILSEPMVKTFSNPIEKLLHKSGKNVYLISEEGEISTLANTKSIKQQSTEKFQTQLLLFFSNGLQMLLASSQKDFKWEACWSSDSKLVTSLLTQWFAKENKVLSSFYYFKTTEPKKKYDNVLSLISTLLMHMSQKNKNINIEKQDLETVLEILKAISLKRKCHDVLYVFVEQIARAMETDRCSIVRIWNGAYTGNVLASHDNARLSDFLIELAKYPEISMALQIGKTVLINDVENDPIMAPVKDQLRHVGFRAILVVPIVLHDVNVGSLLLRATRVNKPFTQHDVNFCEIVAEAAANAIERAYLFELIQRANERLEHLATTDDLTGLRNHRMFRESLEREFERAKRYQHPLSVLILDVDDFKKINDTYGHLQGDMILKEIGGRILRTIRRIDIAARYGGEEIVIIMPQTSLEGAIAQANRILQEIRKSPYPGLPVEKHITASIGVATLDHDNMLDSEALIRQADSAMYTAKRNGKNQVVASSAKEGGSP